jgi:type 1 glutamine amidotransferase
MRIAKLGVLVSYLALVLDQPGVASASPTRRVLVFTKTAGFRHDSIADGIAMLRELGTEQAFAVDTTEDAASFTPATLSAYAAVVWLSTTGDVLNQAQENAFQSYIEAGGGYVGIHSAADTEYDWPWYGELLGGDAWFRSHPAIQPAELAVESAEHLSTAHFPPRFAFTDEWYNFRQNPRASVTVLLTIDETTYDPGPDRMGDHPIAWSHTVGAGRAWYTALGHRQETYADESFRRHVLGGLLWAAGREPDQPTPTPSPEPTPASCAGDCNEDRVVNVDELVRAVGVALGIQLPRTCPSADADQDGNVTIADLIRAVGALLQGCAL